MTRQNKINLNYASREELERLSDVGDECAQLIIEERERRGGFETIEELSSIEGFGNKAIQHLKEEAYVGPQTR